MTEDVRAELHQRMNELEERLTALELREHQHHSYCPTRNCEPQKTASQEDTETPEEKALAVITEGLARLEAHIAKMEAILTLEVGCYTMRTGLVGREDLVPPVRNRENQP